jgi:dihydroorotase
MDSVCDISVKDGRILKIGAHIPADSVKKIIDASGLYVSAGFIDIHTHVFVGPKAEMFADGVSSLSPDDFSFRSGITTVVDAGTSGWRNFRQFKTQVIDVSKTRILAFLNIAGTGMSGKPGETDLTDMRVDSAAATILRYPDIIVGLQVGHYDGPEWTPFDNAIAAANKTQRPVLVECHLPKYSLEDQLAKMRPGDIITHAYENISERAAVTDSGTGKLQPYVLAAMKRGVLFDLGHGGAGFWFSVAVPAVQQGLKPNSFGTDLHRFSMNAGMKSLTNVMSKFMAMGLTLNEVVARATWFPAKSVHREDLGQLSGGAVADITIFSLKEGSYGYVDAGGNKLTGKKKIETELTVREGKIVYDLNGLAATPFQALTKDKPY